MFNLLIRNSEQFDQNLHDIRLNFLIFYLEIVDIYVKKYVGRNESGRQRGRILSAKRRIKDEIHLVELTILAVPL